MVVTAFIAAGTMALVALGALGLLAWFLVRFAATLPGQAQFLSGIDRVNGTINERVRARVGTVHVPTLGRSESTAPLEEQPPVPTTTIIDEAHEIARDLARRHSSAGWEKRDSSSDLSQYATPGLEEV